MAEPKLIPHPKLKHKGAVELDYDMRSESLLVKCGPAMVGYALRRWNIDCSRDYRLRETELQLAPSSYHLLAQIDCSALAPGRGREPTTENR